MPLPRLQTPESLGAFAHPALVAGHPGHELRVFGWMSQAMPRVYLITDGSGRQGVSRTSSSAAVLAGLSALHGEIFGVLSDAEIYRAILEKDFCVFIRLLDQLAASFVKHQIDMVAGDAAEGFNPTHDLCRTLINAAVRAAERATGQPIANFEFCLTEWEQAHAEQIHDSRCRHLILDDELLAQKLAAAREYPELQHEVLCALAHRGQDYFRVECFRKVESPGLAPVDSEKPLYEIWGERRVAEGEYTSVIRRQTHVLPIGQAILDHAEHKKIQVLPSKSMRQAFQRSTAP
jgi:hypothetical protein